MVILDFSQPPVRTFARGFLKGLGAPFVLYGQFQVMPAAVVPPVVAVADLPERALAGDWAKVRGDLTVAMARYEADAARTA